MRAEERAQRRDRELASAYATVESVLGPFEPGLEAPVGDDAASDFGEQLEVAYQHRTERLDSVPWRAQAMFGRLLLAMRRPTKAAELLTGALERMRTDSEVDAAERIEIRRALGHAALAKLDFEASRAQFDEALAECEAQDDLRALRPQVLCDFGQWAREVGDDLRAVELLQRSLDLERSLPEPDRLRIEHVSYYLGSTLERLGDLEPAEALLTEVQQRRLEREGCATTRSLNAAMVLARIHQKQGQYELGAQECEAAIRCAEGRLPEDDSTWLTSLGTYASALQLAGRWGEARTIAERAFRGQAAAFGADHPETLTAEHNLAVIASELGDDERARELLEDVLRRRGGPLTDTDTDFYVTTGMLGRSLARLGRLAEAEAKLSAAYDGLANAPARGPQHENTLTLLAELAGVQLDAGRLEASERSYQAAIDGLAQTLSPAHPKLISVRANLATLYSRQQRHGLAVDTMREVLRAHEAAGQGSTPAALVVRNNLAFNLLEQGCAEEALAVLHELLAIWPPELPRNTALFSPLFVNLDRACAATGRLDDARRHLAVALRFARDGSRQSCDALELLTALDG